MEPYCSLNVSGKFVSHDNTMCTDPAVLNFWGYGGGLPRIANPRN